MKVLFLSNLYPNKEEPVRATFNRQKIAHLKGRCDITVVAPVSWFPFKQAFCRKISRIPFKESIDGMDVYHPRVFYTPKSFRFLYGLFYYLSIRPFVEKLRRDFDFDIIFCAWAYPDGLAAMKLAKTFKIPFVVLAHGSDVHFHTKSSLRRGLMKETFLKADRVIAVSNELKDRILGLGVPQEKVEVIYDGVDHELFRREDKDAAKEKLGLPRGRKTALFVGNLVSVKGLRFLLSAVSRIKENDYTMHIIGGGYLERRLKDAVRALGLEDRVVFCGVRPHNEIPLWLNAAEFLCLPSLAEGLPDIIIEALSCGLPVVASRVGGVPEIINDERIGILVEPKDVKALAGAIRSALDKKWDKGYIQERSQRFSWDENSRRIFECLSSCLKAKL